MFILPPGTYYTQYGVFSKMLPCGYLKNHFANEMIKRNYAFLCLFFFFHFFSFKGEVRYCTTTWKDDSSGTTWLLEQM